MVKLRVFVRDETAEALRALAEDWDAPVSLVARAALEDFLASPQRAVAILGPLLGTLTDTRTPEQREAAERAIQGMLAVDLELVAEQMTHPPQTR